MISVHSHRGLWLILASMLLAGAAGAQPCPCDCNGDGRVSVAELISAVRVSLGDATIASCEAADANDNGAVAINELILGVNAALLGCDAPTPVPATPTPTPDAQLPPTNGTELRPWLESGNYLAWTAESVIHPSGGPHGGTVRTYFNDVLIASLADGAAQHPIGAAAVKELYRNTDEVMGYAVSVKVAAASDGGAGWYWYELIGSAVVADSTGPNLCSNCHRSDYQTFTSRDLILAPYPLQ